jgi:hypothetical protein
VITFEGGQYEVTKIGLVFGPFDGSQPAERWAKDTHGLAPEDRPLPYVVRKLNPPDSKPPPSRPPQSRLRPFTVDGTRVKPKGWPA